MSEVLVKVEEVGKKYCRSLKYGMLYTAADVLRDVAGLRSQSGVLRPGEFWGLEEVSFELRQGECLGLIGVNGAGKSTLLKMLNGIIRPDRGRIRMRGRVGALIEVGAGFHPMLTGRENVYVSGAILGMGKREIDRKLEAILDFSGLDASLLDAPVKSYSSGQYVRLGFAVAVHCEPEILLIDEVLAVGDARFQGRCLNALGAIRNNGTTVILVSHYLNHIAGWADQVLVLNDGKILAFGDPQDSIQAYSDFITNQSEMVNPRERLPCGSGRLRIVGVEILDADNHPTKQARAGEPLTIVIDVDSEEAFHDVELDLKIYSGRSHLISGASSRYTIGRMAVPAGPSQLVAEYPPVPTNGGMLRPSICIWRNNRSEMLDWYDPEPIPVAGLAASEGELWWPPAYSVRPLRREGAAQVSGKR